MSDLVERLRRQSSKLEGQQREYLVMDLMDQAADRIEQLEGIIYRNCDPMAASDEDAKVIYSIAALENKDE